MWKSLYRLLSPGGLIVVTTPNYFGRRGGRFAKDMMSVLRLCGAGPSVRHILEVNTYGHHWRLYSARDIREYFRVLSPDFSVRRVAHFETGRDRSGIAPLAKRRMRQAVPLFRDALYAEIVLVRKQAGITVRPHW
jgi:2-polyprenyl-6-hydroxyphenyl methylase/3-demethylubiquinone-9 3-methyltransferase